MIDKQRNKSPRGITLIELMVVLALVSLAVAVVVPAFSNALDSFNFRNTSKRIESAFRQAQAEARIGQQPVWATYEEGTLTFRSAGDTRRIDLPSGLSVATPDGEDVLFLFLPSGQTIGPASLLLSNTRQRTDSIMIPSLFSRAGAQEELR